MDGIRKHLDEARDGAIDLGRTVLAPNPQIQYAVIVADLFGRISVVVWAQGSSDELATGLDGPFLERCGSYWTGSVLQVDGSSPEDSDDLVARTAWKEGVALETTAKIRLNDRFRHHTAWRSTAAAPPLWPLSEGPPIVVFHAFKGGVGRTTMLAGYALACARRGERVAVVDVDLDAPGIGTLLAADREGTIARWGTVDFLLESADPLPIDDYLHVCAREPVTGAGRIDVVPAGALNDAYLPKLARVDLETHGDVRDHPLSRLLLALKDRKPDRILLDGRAGLSSAAGLLLSGIAHLHVLVATSNLQSLAGLERVVRHLGYEAARSGIPQRDCVVVQALVPEGSEAASLARESFASRVEEMFVSGYYAKERSENDAFWSVEDLDSLVAPHVPVPISYRAALSHYTAVDEIADTLVGDPEHLALHERLDERLATGDTDNDG